jgi:predicted nuclease of predicted toxin-antitoxin system
MRFMWLLDANMDVHLAETLKRLGLECDTAANRGWKALSNGDLVATAAAAGFTCLLTRDQLFGESAARALKSFPEFAVVVVDLPQQRWEFYQRRFAATWQSGPIDPIPGSLIHWPPR